MENKEERACHAPDSRHESLRAGLQALYGHDRTVARRELAWVKQNLDADPSMTLIADYLEKIIES